MASATRFRGHGAIDVGVLDKLKRQEFCIRGYLIKLVFAGHLLAISNDHSSNKYSERSDPVSLSNTKNTSIDVGSNSFECTVGIGNSTASAIVEISFDTVFATGQSVRPEGRTRTDYES